MMLADPSKKYRRMYQRVDLPDRQWPNNEITKAPIWMSTDLRDGNQAIRANEHRAEVQNVPDVGKNRFQTY